MELSTQRLILTEINSDDLEVIHKIHSRPEVDEFATLGIPQNEEDTRRYMELYLGKEDDSEQKYYAWAMCTKENEKDIKGLIGLHNSLDRFKKGELWYKLRPCSWGKGYATEAAREILDFGFYQLQLHRIEAGVATKNTSSIHVLEKIGMQREGLRRKVLPIRGEWIDNFHYAILEDAFFESHHSAD